VIIAHSFGGLVALKAVTLAHHNEKKWVGVFNLFAGMLFLGTPFRGAPGLSHSEMISAAYEVLDPQDVEPQVLEILQRGNESLTELVDDFCETWSNYRTGRLACFYELRQSEVGDLIGTTRRKAFVVGQVEGCLDLFKGVSKHALAKNHFNMNKFADPREFEYRQVKRVLVDTIEAARGPEPQDCGEAEALKRGGQQESKIRTIRQHSPESTFANATFSPQRTSNMTPRGWPNPPTQPPQAAPTPASEFSNMLERYNELQQQTMVENMEMQKANGFWNPLESMSKRDATS
jgi:hypothetical protein